MKNILTTLSACLLVSLFLVSCGGNSQEGTAVDSSKTNVSLDAQQDSLCHTPEYIAQRIDTIYKHRDDARFCSAKFLMLDAQASKLGHEMGHIYRDYDHWLSAQDIAPNWSYKIKEIKDITETTATVEMAIQNFKTNRIFLDLVFERGDWYVDNFHSHHSSTEINEKDNLLSFIYDCTNEKIDKKYAQSFNINKYLDDMIASLDVGDEVLFEKYALIDVDLDGKYEVVIHSLDAFYDAVFSLADGKPVLLVCSDPFTTLDYFEHGVAAQGGCGTGCARGEFCIIKNSRPVCRTAWMDQYNMNGDRVEGEGGYSINDKECDEEAYQKAMSDIGLYVSFNPIWHPIDYSNKPLSSYAE